MPRGLLKAKKYDWKDSNLALFGSDTEKQVKKESAESEPAWQGAGAEPGIKIWRIVNFEVTDWPEDDYGTFFNGDSYIILNTYKEDDSDELLYDVHFWIGKNSTQDEYGTVAYKTVELDTFLDDKPVQHRECQGHESDLFKSYFPGGITTIEGGAESGFRHVPPEEYEARLMKFARDKNGKICVRELKRNPDNVQPGDVYILDTGLKIYQYNGEGASPMEVSKAMQYIGDIKSKRGEAESEVLDGAVTSKNHDFYSFLDEPLDEDPDSDDDDGEDDHKLLKVDLAERKCDVVKEGDVAMDDLCSDDVFVIDTGNVVFVWIGANADSAEKRNGIPYAHDYLRSQGRPFRPISVVKEGQKSAQFSLAIAA